MGGLPGVAWVRSGGWVLLGPGRGRRDVVRLDPPKTAGRLTMNGRGRGTEGGGRGECGLGCVRSVGPMCPVFGRMCPVLAQCVQFRGECVHFGGRRVQFRRCALVGDGARKEREIPSFGRLRAGSRRTSGSQGRSGKWLMGGGEWLVTRAGVGLGGIGGRIEAGDGGCWQ